MKINSQKQNLSGNITATDIKKAMLDHGLTVKRLAERIGKSRSAVSLAIHHPSVVPTVRASILHLLGIA